MPGFAPIVGEKPKVLILGSMPGQRSLADEEYYAHPRNAFWPIMSNLFDIAYSLPYSERVEQLKLAKVAVWDVLHECERVGSLDSAIVRASEQPNDLIGFLHARPSIDLVAFNGKTSETLFKRHIIRCLPDDNRLPNSTLLTSSSPANARLSLKEKTQQWREALSII